ncbi:MAG TPA: transposase [Herpetosiphonaceae bacterium]
MSDTFSTRTVCCTLRVDSVVDTALRETQAAFNAAASYCASVAWEHGITNKNTLHHGVYGATRAQFGLGAQLACCARDQAAAAVRASRQHPNAPCPTFRPDSAIRYAARTYRLMARDHVSLNTVHGRVVAHLDLGDFQRRFLYDLTWAIGGADVIRKRDTWYLCITQSKQVPDPDEPVGVIGCDVGIVHIVTTSDGDMFSGAQVDRVRHWYHTRRQRLQAVGTKSATRRLQKTSGTERRFQKDVNHRISNRRVAHATRERTARAREALTHMRDRVTVQRSQRRRCTSWAFHQVRQVVQYQAALAGVRVIVVDPRTTSRTCAACGYCDKHHRTSQSSFECRSCGHVAVADVNAARTSAYRAAVNPPMASALVGRGASCLLELAVVDC